MGYNTFGPLLVLHDPSLEPARGVAATVVDAQTLTPVNVYEMGETPAAKTLVTNIRGYVGQFQAPDTSTRLRITFGTVTLEVVAQEVQAASVTSVNGAAGAVVITAAGIGAQPADDLDTDVASLAANPATALAAGLSSTIAAAVDRAAPAAGLIVLDNGATAPYSASRPAYPASTVDFRGDSITYSDGGTYPTEAARRLGVTGYNNGSSGLTSTDVAIRKGGIVPVVALDGGAIPADTTETDVATIAPSGDFRASSSAEFYGFTGTLSGIAGILKYYPDTHRWSFTRTDAGDLTALDRPTPFLVSGDQRLDSVTVIMAGRNNLITPAANLDNVTRDIDGIISALTPLNRRYLVLSVTNGTTETTGTANHTAITALNATLSSRYGDLYYDLRSDFIAQGMTIAGLTPTGSDTTAIAGDAPPPSLMVDSVHPNTDGYLVIGTLVATRLAAMGWGFALGDAEYVADNFNRADAATWGDTPVGALTWTLFAGSGGGRNVVSGQGQHYSGSTTSAYHGFDASRADGVFRATLATKGPGSTESVFFRYADNNNTFFLRRIGGGSAERWRLMKVVSGSASDVYAPGSGWEIADGDEVEVRLRGTTVTVLINGAPLYSGTQTDLATNTKFGVGGTAASETARWSAVSLSPL